MNSIRKTAKPRYLAAAVLLLAAASAGVEIAGASARPVTATSAAAQETRLLHGVTMPSEDVDLAFADLGKILEVNVKPGDHVNAGDVLMTQDDRADREQLRALEAKADVTARVELARQRRDLALVQLARMEELRQRGGGSQTELEELQLEAAIAETQIGEEQRQGLVAEAEAAAARVQIEQRTLKSPVEGIVVEPTTADMAAVGEVYGPQTPAVRVVTIDPLKVEVLGVDPEIASRLKVGQSAEIRHPGTDEWRPATVTFIDPVADFATGTRTINLETPNAEGRLTGLDVEVRLPGGGEANPAAAGAGAEAEKSAVGPA